MHDSNRDPALVFMKTLYQNCESGTINLRFKPSDKDSAWNEFIGLNALETIPSKLGKNKRNHCWFGPALRNGSNGTKGGIFSIPCVWLDHDHVADQIDKKIHDFLLPTIVVQTSLPEKKHYYWVFREPCDKDQITTVEDINKRLVSCFEGCSGSFEAAHMMRIPGTFNVKPDYKTPLECKLIELNESCQYNPSDFLDVLPEIASFPTPEYETTPVNHNGRLSKIMECEFLKHCDRDRATLPEPEWYAMVGVLCRETGGPDLIRSLSKGYPGYSPKETSEKILHAMNDAGPATCQHIKVLHDCGRNCGVKSPATLAYKTPTDEGMTEGLSYSNLHLPSSLEISRLEIEVKWVVKNLIPEQGITLLHSIGGVGKTHLLYKMGKCVADGEPFFDIDVTRMVVYYIDFENPLPEISDRMKKIGGSEHFRIWHLGHDPAPIRFDGDEWRVYESFPPGLFIVDSLRSSHLLDESSSKDAAIIMARFKEIRGLGNTIILIHHENKLGGYRGSTAWFDLSDHILKFSRVKAIGSDEDVQDDNLNLPIRLGLGGKSRFSSAMDLNPMYFRFKDHQLCRADDPEADVLTKMAGLLNLLTPPNQSEFQKLVRQNLGIGQKDFRKLLKRGEDKNVWYSKRATMGNKYEYFRG